MPFSWESGTATRENLQLLQQIRVTMLSGTERAFCLQHPRIPAITLDRLADVCVLDFWDFYSGEQERLADWDRSGA